ncbi:CopL family metal-binding regulatory protein [Tahibacter amnicola]|uniref:CopL family metal-binding regulatory protein n=1 Tax=Tahibacter amnicola TaxID=2976241 RepID=A0ABY6B8Q6_9GAMM|nr:CopL family metal-binding regulatory protein [Tahibacter amnicola]UXI66453.1 CopL family metal-binding regulatory protein [Tahibacter amnicola]
MLRVAVKILLALLLVLNGVPAAAAGHGTGAHRTTAPTAHCQPADDVAEAASLHHDAMNHATHHPSTTAGDTKDHSCCAKGQCACDGLLWPGLPSLADLDLRLEPAHAAPIHGAPQRDDLRRPVPLRPPIG